MKVLTLSLVLSLFVSGCTTYSVNKKEKVDLVSNANQSLYIKTLVDGDTGPSCPLDANILNSKILSELGSIQGLKIVNNPNSADKIVTFSFNCGHQTNTNGLTMFLYFVTFSLVPATWDSALYYSISIEDKSRAPASQKQLQREAEYMGQNIGVFFPTPLLAGSMEAETNRTIGHNATQVFIQKLNSNR